MTLWQGRFGGSNQSEELFAFTESLSFDRRLAPDDIACSRAHVRGLRRSSACFPTRRVQTLLAALGQVEEELAEGTFVFKPGDEDVHTAVERRVTEIAGDVGAVSAHRPEPQRPGRHRPAPVHEAGAGRSGRSVIGLQDGPSATGPARPAMPTCPATPTCSAPNQCCWRTTFSRMAGH